MPATIEWADPEKRILINRYEGKWTRDDALHITRTTILWAKEVNRKVDVLVDLRHSAAIPPSAGSVLLGDTKELLTWMNSAVVVGADGYLRTLVNTLGRVLPTLTKQVQYVTSIEEAYRVLGYTPEPER
jgi:hypothetical protein